MEYFSVPTYCYSSERAFSYLHKPHVACSSDTDSRTAILSRETGGAEALGDDKAASHQAHGS